MSQSLEMETVIQALKLFHSIRSALALLRKNLRPHPLGRGYAEQITYVQDRPGHDRWYAIDAQDRARTPLEAG